MRKSRLITVCLPAAMAALVTLGALPQAAQAGLTCKSMVWGYGLHANENMSKLHAYGQWRGKTQSAHGVTYTNYALAKHKSQKCRPKQGKMHCVVKGQPCKTTWGGPTDESG